MNRLLTPMGRLNIMLGAKTHCLGLGLRRKCLLILTGMLLREMLLGVWLLHLAWVGAWGLSVAHAIWHGLVHHRLSL